MHRWQFENDGLGRYVLHQVYKLQAHGLVLFSLRLDYHLKTTVKFLKSVLVNLAVMYTVLHPAKPFLICPTGHVLRCDCVVDFWEPKSVRISSPALVKQWLQS